MADEQNVKIVITALDKTKVGLTTITKGLRGVARVALNLKTALISAAGIGGFGYLVKQSLNATDTLAKTATKIGTTTEALSRLRYAAGLASVETRTVDMAMQRFTRRLSEAANNTGEAKSALRELGIDARALQKIPLDEQMYVLADAFQNLSSGTDDVRLGFKLFDSEGLAFINVLKTGSAGLREMFNEAEMLGAVMSGGAAKGVERASDALTRMGTLIRGLVSQFVAALAPAIETATTALKDWALRITEAEGGIEQFAKNAANNFLNSVETIVVAAARGANAVNSMFKDDGKKDELQTRLDAQKAALSKHEEYLQELKSGNAGIIDRFLFGDLGLADTAIKDTEAEIDLIQKKIAGFQNQLANLGGDSSDLIDIDGLLETFATLRAGIQSVGESSTANLGDVPSLVDRIKTSFKNLSQQMPSVQENIDSLVEQSMNGFTNSVTAAISGAAKFADAIKSMAKSVVDSLIKMLVQYYITKPLFDAITGGISGGAGGGATTPPTPRAIGGSVQAGQPYMVGERGQELFVPSQSGSIIPNNKLQSGGGVTVNQTINVSTGVSQTVRSEIVNLMPQIAAHAKAAVAEGRLRGGTYSKQLVGG
jgi:hypothetical protein